MCETLPLVGYEGELLYTLKLQIVLDLCIIVYREKKRNEQITETKDRQASGRPPIVTYSVSFGFAGAGWRVRLCNTKSNDMPQA